MSRGRFEPLRIEMGKHMGHSSQHPHHAGTATDCSDGLGRKRQLDAWVRPRGTRVILRVPPGEIALLTAGQARDLSEHLTDLAQRIDTPNQAHPATGATR
jgi:hypothetical protein